MINHENSIIRLKPKSVLAFMIFAMLLSPTFSGCKKEMSVLPYVTTKSVIIKLNHSAESGGIIGENGNVPIISRGVVWSTEHFPVLGSNVGFTVDGNGTGEFSSSLNSLAENTLYYLRAYAKTNSGVVYGNEEVFVVLYEPLAVTDTVSRVSCTGATLNGFVNVNMSTTLVSFEIGTSTDYGLTISGQNSIKGSIDYRVSLELTSLSPNTLYHYRIKAENVIGTEYGRDITFSTKEGVSDIDGNIYSVLKIGHQSWMMENLKTIHYSNGEPIPAGPSAGYLTSAGYWNYANNNAYVATYGRLYNFFVANDNRNICPVGWHVSSYDDFDYLIRYLGGKLTYTDYYLSSTVGGKMKEQGFDHWQYPNTGATNEFEFAALPGGIRRSDGTFSYLGNWGSFWLPYSSQYLTLSNSSVNVYIDGNIFYDDRISQIGSSIRCVKGTVAWVDIKAATDIKTTSATLHGFVKANNLPADVYFKYGLESTFSDSVLAIPSPVNGNDLISVNSEITGLAPGMTYKYIIKAITSEGISRSSSSTFTTLNSQ
jgi:uncharacterized protein (TIGR02145 family)